MRKAEIKIIISCGDESKLKKRRFTIDFEVDSVAWDHWKGKQADHQYIEKLIQTGLSKQGQHMSGE